MCIKRQDKNKTMAGLIRARKVSGTTVGEPSLNILGEKRDGFVLSIIIVTAIVALADFCGRQEASSALALLEAMKFVGRRFRGGREQMPRT